MFLAVLILAVSCAPASSNPVDSTGPAPGTAAPQETYPEEAPATGIEEQEPADNAKTGRSSFESEDLFGLGEIGLLPALLQSFGTAIDCDFDDALSTCQ